VVHRTLAQPSRKRQARGPSGNRRNESEPVSNAELTAPRAMVFSVRLSSVTNGPAPRHPDGTSSTPCPNLRQAAKPHQQKWRRTGHPRGPGPARPGRPRAASDSERLGMGKGRDAPQGRPVAAVEHPGLGATRGAGGRAVNGAQPGRPRGGQAGAPSLCGQRATIPFTTIPNPDYSYLPFFTTP
jgi:hypothetical protein